MWHPLCACCLCSSIPSWSAQCRELRGSCSNTRLADPFPVSHRLYDHNSYRPDWQRVYNHCNCRMLGSPTAEAAGYLAQWIGGGPATQRFFPWTIELLLDNPPATDSDKKWKPECARSTAAGSQNTGQRPLLFVFQRGKIGRAHV